MARDNLISKLKRGGAYVALAAGFLGLGAGYGCGSDGIVKPPPGPSISQTARLIDYIDINYTATLREVSEATRKTFRNDTLINTKTIISDSEVWNQPITEILEDNLKGDYMFVLEARGVDPDTAEVSVPDYESEAPNLSGLDLDVNERDSIVVHLARATDKNIEDNPVHYNGVASSEVEASIGDFPDDTILTITAPEITGPDPVPYQIELSRQGSPNKITLEGRVLDVPGPPQDQIAFLSDMDSPYYEIYRMNIDKTGLVRLTNNGDKQDLYPYWSPDGQQIAFTTNREDVDGDGSGEMSIYIMDYDGANQRRISPPLDRAAHPVWCANGKVLFNYKDSGTRGIAAVNPDGTGFEKIVERPSSSWLSGRPACSPDASQIAFTDLVDGNMDIYLVDSNGENLKRLTIDFADDVQPAWSPDGSKIAFISDRSGNGSLDMYLINPDGNNLQQITNDIGHEVDPNWSPDGTEIAFAHNDQILEPFASYIMNSDGTNWREIVPAVSRYPVWRPRQE